LIFAGVDLVGDAVRDAEVDLAGDLGTGGRNGAVIELSLDSELVVVLGVVVELIGERVEALGELGLDVGVDARTVRATQCSRGRLRLEELNDANGGTWREDHRDICHWLCWSEWCWSLARNCRMATTNM